MGIHLFRRATLCAALLFVVARVAQADSYYLKDLGTLGGNTSQAYALNNSGQVVGYADTSNNVASHAVLFSGTGSNNIDLGNLGFSNNSSEARSINDSGQIVGWSLASSGYFRATRFSGTGTSNIDLGTLCDPTGTGSSAWAINNSGTMVGDSEDCFYNDSATQYSGTGSGNGNLGGVGGGVTGLAYDINSSGQIVGYATRKDQSQQATLFTGAVSNNFDLGTIGGFNSHAFGINKSGQIVGDSDIIGNAAFHAVLFSGTGTNNFDLGTLGGSTSHADAINDLGEIVGNSYPATNNNSIYHAFIFENGIMSDLNGLVLPGSGFTNIRLIENGSRVPGRCINNSGQIAAVGEIGGRTHAVLLTPVLRHIQLVLNGNDLVIDFDAFAGQTYRLEQTLDLTNPNWQPVAGVNDFSASATGSAQFTYANGATMGKAFYRVRLL